MLQETVDRLLLRFPLNDIYIATNKAYADEVREELPDLPEGNLIAEPSFRERASSIALACALLKGNENETLAILPSDHLIKNKDIFLGALAEADDFIRENPRALLTIGIRPTGPETGYGYIKHEVKSFKQNRFDLYKVESFFEKPDFETVKRYLKNDVFLWNSGIYVCRIGSIMERLEKFIPDTFNRLQRIRECVGTNKLANVIAEEYPLMDMISFEYGIVENDKDVVVIAADLGWSDVGSWSVLKDSIVGNSEKNLVKGEHLDIGSKNLLVYGSKKLIATIGLEDLIIVDTEDAILVCDKNNTQLVKDLVNKMEHDGKKKLL